jgi:RNA polymerase-binding transcription factor DksA
MAKKNMTQLARKALLRRGRNLIKPRSKAGAKAMLAGLSDVQRHELEEVHAALERIERGIFGACEACGDRIDEARIEQVPYVRSCGPCSIVAPSDALTESAIAESLAVAPI